MTLGHETSSVYFTLVVYLNLHLDSLFLLLLLLVGAKGLGLAWRLIVKSRVELLGVFGGLEGQLDFDNLNVVLFVVGSVRDYQQPLVRIVA